MLQRLRQGDVRLFFGQYADIALAALMILIIGMMIVPLPPLVLDLLISLNIAAAFTLLLIGIYVSDALRIATFPTLLLLTTLFRLSLEVSATRLILLRAHAGSVIAAFGNFVVAGNLVVGAVIFLILTIIQFVVIAKGAERVAEVGARFTLDAMPGKQMSIDAELRAGHIDHEEARRRRRLLGRESQFFGAMDGAMKFVKGDAVAGLVVLLVNIVGGLVIGVMQRGMDLGTAARTFTVLTIGGGLVAQIPALIVSTAAGIIVTRVSSDEEGGHLAADMGKQILAEPRALAIAAVLLVLLAAVPGLPTGPFLVLGLVLGFVAYRLLRSEPLPTQALRGTLPAPRGPALAPGGGESPSPLLVPIAIQLSPDLSAAVLSEAGGGTFLGAQVPAVREQLFGERGLWLPSVKLQASAHELPAGTYQIRLNEVPMGRGWVDPNGHWTGEPPQRLAALQLSLRPGAHPDGTAGHWIGRAQVSVAEAAGVALLSAEEIMAAHLLALMRRYGHEFLGVQEAQRLLDGLERTHPVLVREVVPKIVSPVLLADVLRRLAEEGISLRGMREILGALATWAPQERDPVALTEHVRGSLRRVITHQHSAGKTSLGVYLLDPMIEETIREAIHRTPSGSYLALEPSLSRDILLAVGRTIPAAVRAAVILTQADLRRFVRRLVETQHPEIAVLSYQELSPEAHLQPLGRIQV